MQKKEFEQAMEQIVESIRKAGYSPYNQITGYLITGDATYITRFEKARELIQTLDKEQITQYVQENCCR